MLYEDAMKRVVVLGAGFGGLEVAARLAELAPSEVEVTLVDRSDAFYVGFTKIDVLFGRSSPAEVRHLYRDLAPKVAFRREEVLSIDPAARRVTTSGATLEADAIVVALGADLDVGATPGFREHGFEVYSLEGVERAAAALAGLRQGQVLVSILGAPYKCPPAPFEIALQLRDALDRRGAPADFGVRITTPAPSPLPVSKEGSAKLLELMSARAVAFSPSTLVTSLEAGVAITKAGERIAFDLFLGVPVHRAPRVVVEAGLAPEGGWVPVDARTLETRFPFVYAIGDVTTIPVGQGAVPKAGAFADRAARAVADDLVHRWLGRGERGHFDGAGTCYVELGEGNVAMIDASFLGGPAPEVKFLGPSPDLAPSKAAFASERLSRWFSA